LPYDSKLPPPSPELIRLVRHADANNTELLIGCDANAHHTVWGSSDINKRGDSLLQFIGSTRLEILNINNEPTFINKLRQEVIDMTLVTRGITHLVSNWHVSSEASMSDHRWICFRLCTTLRKPQPYRNPRKTNIVKFLDNVSMAANHWPQCHIQNTEELFNRSDALTSALTNSFEKACPPRAPKPTCRSSAWWCKELDQQRHVTRTSFNEAKRKRSEIAWQAYKAEKNKYSKLLRQKQRQAWQTFCGSLTKVSEAARLNKVLAKDPQLKPHRLKKTDGSLTSNPTETINNLMFTHFPDCVDSTSIDYHSNVVIDGYSPWVSDICNVNKIAWAISSYSPFKAAGVDGIFPALLQWAGEVILHELRHIFMASLQLGTIPPQWRQVKAIFIPKPGKSDYSNAKAFRPISLTSFLLKTLEKLCERELRDNTLRINPLHKMQHAFRPGYSTESALHGVVTRLEETLDSKEFALAVFLDIEGAFDKTTFQSVDNALRARDVNDTLSAWVLNMLHERHVQVSIGDVKVTKRVTKGCPQGGVLSPLLWNLVIDELLSKLNNNGYWTIGYADDLVIIIRGRFLGTICNLMQSALKMVEEWCRNNDLTVNPSKTEMTLFTRKRLRTGFVPPVFFGQVLNLNSHTKFLGVTLDEKLNWNVHIESKVKKATMAFWQCRRIVGRSWGLSPKIVHWMYGAVIRPALSYGALVWWKKAEQVSAQAQLGKVQRMACLAISGAMRTAPTSALEALLCLLPLEIHLKQAAAAALLRLKHNNLIVNPYRHVGHKTCLLPHEEVWQAVTDVTTKKHNFVKKYRVLAKGGESLPMADVNIFTDGSKAIDGTGAGIHCAELGLDESLQLRSYNSILQAELAGIQAAASLLVDLCLTNRTINFYSDSQSALRLLEGWHSKSLLTMTSIDTLNRLAGNNRVTLTWVKAHSTSEGNQKADELAKQGRTIPTRASPTVVGLSCDSASSLLAHRAEVEHRLAWRAAKCRYARSAIKNPSKERARALFHLSRKSAQSLSYFLTGHGPFNKHLHRMGLVQDPTCRGCGEGIETAEHILCSCPAIATARFRLLGSTLANMDSVGRLAPPELLSLTRKATWLV
jgi:ribonuclease HI